MLGGTLRVSASPVVIVGAVVTAVAFAGWTAAVVSRALFIERFDVVARGLLARIRSPATDGVAGPLSTFATREPLALQAIVAFALLLVTGSRTDAARFAIAAVGAGTLTDWIKRTVARPRPARPYLIPWFGGFSYPSGDLATASAIYSTLVAIVGRALPDPTAHAALLAILVSVIALLAVCRVYVGVHHPSDVLGGVLLGIAWALAVAAGFAT